MGRVDSELWKAKMASTFTALDANGNGYLTADDLWGQLARLAEAYGVSPGSGKYTEFEASARAWVDDMLNSMDKSGDDQISLDEFLEYFSEASNEAIKSWVDRYVGGIFIIADADNDGKLTKDEYMRFVIAQGHTETDAEAAFAALDADDTGYISRDEFVHHMFDYTVATEEAAGNKLFGAVG